MARRDSGNRLAEMFVAISIAPMALLGFGVVLAFPWVPIVLIAVLSAFVAREYFRTVRPRRLRLIRAAYGQCLACGYDLRGSQHSMRCPECGEEFEARCKARYIFYSPGALRHR